LEVQAVFYSYWFDRWALILSIARERIGHGSFNFFSRAHGYEIFKDQTELGYHPFKRYMLSGVTKVYTVSKQGRDYLKHSFSKFSGKISYAYLGVKSNSVNAFNDNTFHILSCAHVRSIKRLDMVCDILAEMPQHVKIKWTLIGGGVDLANIKTKAATLPGNIACVFTGNLSSGEVLRYYSDNSISLFLSVSRSEGLPYTMMEAISFGIPLMATDVGGCSEICTDKTGIIIPKNFDPKEVANQIIDFSKSELNTPEFRAGVRQFWEENFNAQKNYHSFYQLISNYAA
jgi:glycosyltransferase involved in cell wall biosynthesis